MNGEIIPTARDAELPLEIGGACTATRSAEMPLEDEGNIITIKEEVPLEDGETTTTTRSAVMRVDNGGSILITIDAAIPLEYGGTCTTTMVEMGFDDRRHCRCTRKAEIISSKKVPSYADGIGGEKNLTQFQHVFMGERSSGNAVQPNLSEPSIQPEKFDEIQLVEEDDVPHGKLTFCYFIYFQ